MSKRHIWRIKKEYYLQLQRGEKSIEVRVGYGHVKSVKTGDTISFENYGRNEFTVARVVRYSSFDDLLSNENVSRVLPGFSKGQAITALRDIYPKDKELLGVYAFELNTKEPKPLRRKSACCIGANR